VERHFAARNNPASVDLVISASITDKRKQSDDFSPPYFIAHQLIAVPRPAPRRRSVARRKTVAGREPASTADDVAWRGSARRIRKHRRFESTPRSSPESPAGRRRSARRQRVMPTASRRTPELDGFGSPSFLKKASASSSRRGQGDAGQAHAGLAAIRADGSYRRSTRKWFRQGLRRALK